MLQKKNLGSLQRLDDSTVVARAIEEKNGITLRFHEMVIIDRLVQENDVQMILNKIEEVDRFKDVDFPIYYLEKLMEGENNRGKLQKILGRGFARD